MKKSLLLTLSLSLTTFSNAQNKMQLTLTYGFGCIFWDNGYIGSENEQFGVINHGTGDFIGDGQVVTEIMRKAYYTEDPIYTLQSIYNRAPNPRFF